MAPTVPVGIEKVKDDLGGLESVLVTLTELMIVVAPPETVVTTVVAETNVDNVELGKEAVLVTPLEAMLLTSVLRAGDVAETVAAELSRLST